MDRGGVEGALDPDVAIGMDGAFAGAEEGESLGGKRTESIALGFEEVGPDLFAGRAVDAQASDGPIPAPQVLVLVLETVEASSLEGVALDVTTASFLLAVFLGVSRPDG